ncbi:MAG: hypothetical protein ACFFCD_15440 [Promethearchaeota archaeon]
MIKGKQPMFGLVGWALEWITAIVLYLVCTALLGWDWFRVTSVALLGLFFGFWFSDFQNWPFNKLGIPGMGIVTSAVSLILGGLTWEYLRLVGWDPYTWAFPIIVTLYFLFLVTAMAFGNVHLEGRAPIERAFINFVIYFFGTWLILACAVAAGIPALQGGIPAHWFPIAQFYFLSLGAWITRERGQPAKGVVDLIVVIFITFLYIVGLGAFGVPTAILAFNPQLIAWVAILSATGVPLFVFLGNYPWRRLKQPWMGIAGFILLFVIGAITMTIMEFGLAHEYTTIIALGFCAVTTEFFMAFQFLYGVPECFGYLAGGATED